MIRLIVSDLDGTLLLNHDRIHPENLAALQEARARGVQFAVASGRSGAACSILLDDHGLSDTAILAVNGCHVMDRPFGQTLAMHCLREGAAREILRVLSDYGLAGCLYATDAIVYTSLEMRQNEEAIHENPVYDAQMKRAGMVILSGPEALAAHVDGPVMKVYCVSLPGQERAFAEAREACAAIAGVALTSSWHTNFEVMPEGVDKGTAVAELATQLGIAREEVAAFGDNENDLPMLRWAGHAYAMGNAQDCVLREVPNVTGTCDAGGVAMALRRLLREE